jgi:thiamine-monophosphate kinase
MAPPDEFARIAALTRGLSAGQGVVLGPGDDAAVLRPRAGWDLVATTDAFIEDRHFRRGQLPPGAIGRRLAAANLSDLAAMAALPRWALFSLVVPAAWDEAEVREVQQAAASALEAEGAAVVGGNLARTEGPFVAGVTLLGEVQPGRHFTRSGARPDDVLAVTGRPGAAARALAAAAAGEDWPADYLAPPCRVRLAWQLDAAALGPGALEASDDYELLLAIDPERFDSLAALAHGAGAPLTRLGACTEAELRVRSPDGALRALPERGYDHFG